MNIPAAPRARPARVPEIVLLAIEEWAEHPPCATRAPKGRLPRALGTGPNILKLHLQVVRTL
eukprot:6110639-Pyramimonas_sp.AAC.1